MAAEDETPLRVTHVVFDLDGGGLESLVGAMAMRFHGSPVTMSVVTLGGREGRVGGAIRPFVDQFHIPSQLRGVSMFAPLSVASAVRATRADVVHVHSGCWFKGASAARLAGVPRVIYTEHGREHHDPPLSRWLDRRAAARTDVVAAVSARLARYLADTVGVARSRIVTIGNGVDTEAYAPGPASDDLRTRLGIPTGALVVGSVGRLEAVKAFHLLIQAVARLRGAGAGLPPLALVICGEGGERAALEAEVARLGAGDTVRLPGWTDRAADFYRLLDVFVLSSHSEGASVSLMEAMASGVSPVVTDVGANAQIVGPSLASQVVPPGDAAALAAAICVTLSDRTRREAMSRTVRERAERHYSLAAMTAAYESVYRRGIAGAPEAAS